MIDWVRVRELRGEIGGAGLAEVVELFLEEVEDVLGRLDCAAGARQLAADIHFLKGCAWNLGFREFGASCQDRERDAMEGRCTESLVGELRLCYGRSRETFLTGLAGVESEAARDG